MSSTAKQTDAYPHQKRYMDRMTARGYQRITVWVPEHRAREVSRLAEKMRKDYERNKD